MSLIRSKDTKPELLLRRQLFARGYRYRLHDKRLPGKPDLIFPKRRKVVFVHGCFWHGHSCPHGRMPKSKQDYWAPKIAANQERDAAQQQELAQLGWQVMVVWECELKELDRALEKVTAFLC